jgi:hypothetical protein
MPAPEPLPRQLIDHSEEAGAGGILQGSEGRIVGGEESA